MSDQTTFVGLGKVAKCLGVAPTTIYNCMKDGRIPSYTYFKLGKNYRFDLQAIISILREKKDAPQQTEAKQEVTKPIEKVSEKPLQEPSPQLEFDFDADLDI